MTNFYTVCSLESNAACVKFVSLKAIYKNENRNLIIDLLWMQADGAMPIFL